MLYNLEQGKNLSDFDFAQQCRIWTDLAKKANPNPNPNPNPSPNPSPNPNPNPNPNPHPNPNPNANPNPNPNQGRELSPCIGALAQLPPRIRALPPDLGAFWFSPLSAFPSLMKHMDRQLPPRLVSLSRHSSVGSWWF